MGVRALHDLCDDLVQRFLAEDIITHPPTFRCSTHEEGQHWMAGVTEERHKILSKEGTTDLWIASSFVGGCIGSGPNELRHGGRGARVW